MSSPASAVRPELCLLLVATLVGCGNPLVCTGEARPGLVVSVEHAGTGEPVAGALVVASDGAFADSARTREGRGVILALERPGTYEVTAEKEGFFRWTRSGVEVDEGPCHVETVALTARLTPNSN